MEQSDQDPQEHHHDRVWEGRHEVTEQGVGGEADSQHCEGKELYTPEPHDAAP